MTLRLKPRTTPGGQVRSVAESTWRLSISAGSTRSYRLAQLDDYTQLSRRSFLWSPPITLTLRARASTTAIPGTWGMGLWNDPFSLSLGLGGTSRRLPALPNAAWFFFASPPNYLSLRDDLPAQGALAATFRSAEIPTPLLALGLPILPLVTWSRTAGPLRRLARRFIQQDATSLQPHQLNGDALTHWCSYMLEWLPEKVVFRVNEKTAMETAIVPNGPLGLVIWVDNQYAALPPEGGLAFGTLANPEPIWVEVADIEIGRQVLEGLSVVV